MATQHFQAGAHRAAQLSVVKPACWSQHFKDEEYSDQDRRAVLIAELLHHFQSPAGWSLLTNATSWFDKTTIHMDWRQLTRCGSKDLPEAMLHSPADALSCIAAAAHEALFVSQRSHHMHPGPSFNTLDGASKVLIRLNHHPSLVPISAVRADQVSRLVTIRGTIIRATPVRPMVTSMTFICAKCGAPKDVEFPDGRFVQPQSCGSDGCRARTLNPDRSSATCIDWQRVQVQGLPRDEKGNEGRVPSPIDVELLEDLAGSCTPGDVVTVTGLVKVINGEPASGQ